MARVFLFSKPTPNVQVFYGIDQAVGKCCPNKRDDVALVQFLLRSVLEDGKEYKVPPGPPLVIDGICGPRTIEYINAWQEQESRLSEGIMKPVQDGQVSPALTRSGIGSRSHARYSIVGLNTIYGFTDGGDKNANIARDPRCPTNLLPSIFWV